MNLKPLRCVSPSTSRSTAILPTLLITLGLLATACSGGLGANSPSVATTPQGTGRSTLFTTGTTSTTAAPGPVPLPAPSALQPFGAVSTPGDGNWRSVGRAVQGSPAVYETELPLPDNPSALAGIAWMDTNLIGARLYSGSLSPGGFFWKYTAPVSSTAASTLVAAFNGGFLVKDSAGGYMSEGTTVAPLRVGAASLVIYDNGNATVGQWGRDVSMSSSVAAVRQNLTLLVDNSQALAGLNPADISAWGLSLGNITNPWRSGLGATSNGALVYVAGQMNIVDLAEMLVKAGAVRAMTLDMNPLWTVFATYAPVDPGGPAAPSNGTDLLTNMVQSPSRFFQSSYTRDFVTMSAR